MAKGIGLIGNFKGKVGNMVGYKLSDSNTGNTQGIRVYQPIVRNPKTSAQAEQRAKLAPINATYRALKMVIDRGNEGLPYGNKSRLAWLKSAFKAEDMPWFEKGQQVYSPVLCQITKGSLPTVAEYDSGDSHPIINITGMDPGNVTTLGNVCEAIMGRFTFLKKGDQITFVQVANSNGVMLTSVDSIVLDAESAAAIPSFLTPKENAIEAFSNQGTAIAVSIIVSREGANGEHLRSTEVLAKAAGFVDSLYEETAKAAAVESYMSSASANVDWAEESIQ